jgi:Secretion system C-terminal sorting domain
MSKHLTTALVLIMIAGSISAQVIYPTVVTLGPAPIVVRMDDTTIHDWHTTLLNVREAPKHTQPDIEIKKRYLNTLRQTNTNTHRAGSTRAGGAPMPIVLDSFLANGVQTSTPLDNAVAVSNSGLIVSCVNSDLKILDESGTVLYTRSLGALAPAITGGAHISDPRVIYDPQFDRFIVLFFYGNTSATSNILVGFTKTNDPTGLWNYYKLSGNSLNDTTWSDYPIISISQADLFISFNHLADNKGWKDGFRYSVIWQIDKQKGYNGDTLTYNYWHDIKHANVPIWNICPVQDGSWLAGAKSYFLSVRPSDLSNDTVFLHEISNTYQSGTATLHTTVLKTSVPYGLSPNAHQRDGQQLATNDARVLSAFIQGSTIQYVQNSIDPTHLSSGIYWGSITAVPTAPVATGQIIGYDTVDLGYPSIAYVGRNGEMRSIVNCSYLNQNGNPGTGALYRDANGNISDLLRIREGQSTVNILADTIERWGDYSGIQRKYNDTTAVWLSGSYTNTFHKYLTLIAKLDNADTARISSIHEVRPARPATVYPNPAYESIQVKMEVEQTGQYLIELYDVMGSKVRLLYDDSVKAGTNVLTFSTAYLSSGSYWLRLTNSSGLVGSYPVLIDSK